MNVNVCPNDISRQSQLFEVEKVFENTVSNKYFNEKSYVI